MRRGAPAVFVLLWSTGFIVARYATRDSGAFTFLTVRTAIAAVVLFVLARAVREAPVSADQRSAMLVVGLGMHAMYLGGVFYAIEHGMPSGVTALLAALHPVMTAALGRAFLGEVLNRARAAGIVLGCAGVVAVVVERGGAGDGIPANALLAMVVAVLGMSTGTLLQRRGGRGTPLLAGTAWQYVSTTAVLGSVALIGEGWRFGSTARTWWSMAWAVGVLSIAAILVMLWLLRRQAAAEVSSLFFLTPALSSVEAAVLFSESLGILAVTGLCTALAGVWLATSARFATSPRT
ncbi:MAG: DMT family transporter [Actinomycetota bacterium]